VSTGNCLMDALQFSAAFEAYMKAHAALGPTGDVAVQLGHLFKESGNFPAALEAYRWSKRFGDVHGGEEIAGFPCLRAGVVRFGQQAEVSPERSIPLGVFHAVLDCDLGDSPDPAKLRSASRALEGCGEPEAARAFAEAAYLIDSSVTAFEDHIRHIASSTLWPGSLLKRFIDPETQKSQRGQGGVTGLYKLAFVAAGVDAPAPRPDLPPKSVEWPPRELSVEQARILLANLSALTNRALLAIALGGDAAGVEAIDAVRALHDATSPAGAFVTFAEARTREGLTQICARILHDILAGWVARASARYLQETTSAQLVGAFLELRENPLARRIVEVGSLQAIAYEIDGLLIGALREKSATRADAARAALYSVCLQDVSREAAREWLTIYRRPDAPMTCAALIAACHVGHLGGEGEIVSQAQDLKAIGLHGLANAVMERGLDEKLASRSAVIEWALIAKINGDFPHAARLLEQGFKLEPSDFLRRELVAVLPEVEPVSSIISRFADDAEFLRIAGERAIFALALAGEPSASQGRLPSGERIADLAPEIAPELRLPVAGPGAGREQIEVLDLGRRRRWDFGQWRRQLRRIDFVRVRVASCKPLTKLRVRIDGRTVGQTQGVRLQAGYELSPLSHMIFNCWFDLSGVNAGLHEIQLYFEEWDGGYRTWEDTIWFDAQPTSPEAAAASAAIVDLDDAPSGASLEERIASAPSLALPAKRQTFHGPFEKILVVRADQLGDTVMSVPAMLALKRHFPEASLVGLFSPAQAELMKSLGLFTELLFVNLRYDQKSRTRNLALAEQSELKQKLSSYCFDLAIDLSPGLHSRPLLHLAGARYTAGFRPSEFPWMSFGIDVQSRDAGNSQACLSHSHAPESLVESLALAIKRPDVVLPKAELNPAFALGLGLPPGRRFAVIHAGARTASRKWPVAHFLDVARRLVREAHLYVVMLLDSPADLAAPPEDLNREDFQILNGALSFADFDGLLSQCAVFIGNDTGPKHLAALRGTPVVSIHMGAVNWSEWGQDGSGVILTRRVPCYGCGIELIEECGKGLPCLFGVSPDEVFAAASKYVM
jgi:ADP-heptose:LPS heptosyltransferase